MDDIPYLARGVSQISTLSSVLVSSSPYLDNPRLRDWIATIVLRKNGPDKPPPAEMHELLGILDELRDYDRIEELFAAERKVNPLLDAWFEEHHISRFSIEDLKDYPPDSIAGIFYRQMMGGNYEIQIVPFAEPASQLEFFNLRSGQTHDWEHILTGGGFNFMGELVPYWFRLANVPRFFKDQHLAREVNMIQIFGSLRYLVRTQLHYPEVWQCALGCIERGMKVGQASDALFLKKIEDAFHLPLDEARAALGVRDAVDVDTAREGAFWVGKGRLEEV